MTNILKLRQGRKVSLAEYNQAKSEFDDFYQNADDNTRAKLDGLLLSSYNYSSADPMNNRSAREYATQIYKNAVKIGKGEYAEAPNAIASTKNIFNGYSNAENIGNANYVTSKYLNHAGRSTGQRSTKPSSSGLYHEYNWAKGLDAGWGLETDTLEDRMSSFAQTLANNLREAKNAKASGRDLVGINESTIDQALAFLNKESWTKNDFKLLMNAARIAGVDPQWFMSYFGELVPGMDPVSRNKKRFTDEGYEFVEGGDYGSQLNDLIRSKGYRVARKGNENYLINGDYSGFASDALEFNTDWRNGLEGTGYVIKNGKFISGDLNNAYNENSELGQSLRDYVKSQDNESRAIWKNYNRFTDLSKFDIISDNAAALHGKSVADMSKYFDSEVPIVATVEGDNWNALKSKYGHTKVDNDKITYYWKDAQGNHSGKYSDLVRSIGDKLNLKKDSLSAGYTNWSSAEVNLDQLTPETENLWEKDINRYNQFLNFFSNKRYWKTNKNLWSKDKIDADQDIVKNPQGTARMLVQLWATDDSELTDEQKRIKNRWWNQYSTDAIYLIYDLLKKNPDLFKADPRYNTAWHTILKAYKNKLTSTSAQPGEIISTNKEGGVLSAKEGTYIDLAGNEIINPNSGEESNAARVRRMAEQKSREKNALDERAAKYGRTPYRQKASEQAWSSADTLRATALATDVAGLIAAIAGPATGGAGSVIAVGSGFVSMGQDLAADIMDDSVSAGRATKNALINSGLAVGAMFGAKAPKIVKGVLKILPKAMMAAGAAGIAFDPEVHNTLNRMQEGKTMNAADWRNILMVLRTVTGIATVGTVNAKAKKGASTWDKTYKGRLKQLTEKSELNDNVKYLGIEGSNEAIAVPKETYNAVSSALAKAKTDEEVVAALKPLLESKENNGAGLTETQARSLVESITGKRGYKFWKKEFWGETPESYKLREATTELVENLTGADLQANARLLAIQDIRRANQKGWKSGLMKKLEKTETAEKFSPSLNRALNGTSYKNIKELISGEEAKLPAYRPSQKGKSFESLTPEKNNQFIKDVAGEMHAESESQKSALNIEGLRKKVERSQKSLGRLEEGKATLEQERQGYIDKLLRLDSELLEAKRAKVTSAEKLRKIDDILSQIDEINQQITSNDQLIANYRGSKGFKKYLALIDAENNARLLIDSNTAIGNLVELNPETNRYKLIKGINKYPKALVNQAKSLIADHTKAINELEKAQKTAKGSQSSASRNYSEYKDAIKYNRKNKGTVASLLKEITDLKKELTGISDAINNKNQELRTLGIEYRNKNYRLRIAKASEAIERRRSRTESLSENVKSATELMRKAVQELKVKSIASRGRDLGNTRKPVTVALNGTNTVINRGTNTKSYTTIRDAALAKKAALQGRPNAKELSQADIRKIYPSNMTSGENAIRGAAYDPTANELVVWHQGGKINSKYSHLRK